MGNSNLDFVIIGELYLKRGPDSLDITGCLTKIDDEIHDIEFAISKENPEFYKAPLLDIYQKSKDKFNSSLADVELDYSGTESFWQLFTSDGININLVECEKLKEGVRTYSSKKDLDKDFIKLSDFLEKATFVGREFKRIKPIKSTKGRDDERYMQSYGNNYCIVLFCTQDLFLVRECFFGDESYKLLNSRYTLDGKYEFLGPEHEEYRDKNKVYSEILAQINEYNKGRGRKH